MKYVLFIGSKLGYEALKILNKLNCNILHVFIEMDHDHEYVKYFDKSIEYCITFNLSFNLNASKREIQNEIDMINSLDYIMSFGYRRMISEMVISKASKAAIGSHFAPLPRYRGFAPLNWVLINGEEETAVNLFYLDNKVDNGEIIASRKVKIDYLDDINSLYEKCINMFSILMEDTMPLIEGNCFQTEKQDDSKATYTCSRSPEDGLIEWNWNSRKIYNYVRALTYPFPGAFTFFEGKKITIWTCEEFDIPLYEGVIPGKVIKIIKNVGVVVLCGDGAILLKEIATEEQQKNIADDILNSLRLTLGRKK